MKALFNWCLSNNVLMVNGAVFFTHSVAKGFKGKRLSLKPHKERRPSIERLLRRSSPSTIFWAVVAVYIYAINRVRTAWSLAHILKEVGKNHPSLANRYTPSSIQPPARVAGDGAPSNHALPNIVHGLPALPVNSRSLYDQLSSIAPARDNFLVKKVVFFNLNSIPAVTKALVKYFFAALWRELDYNKPIHSFANEGQVGLLPFKEIHAAK